jgi:hypothetical protein
LRTDSKKLYNKKKYLPKKLHPILTAIGPFAQILVSQNCKGKYESMKILDFVRKDYKK